MMEGLCASEISEAMFISMATTRTYIRNILWKLNVKSQLAAVAYVRRMQIPCPDERRRTVEEVLVGGTLTTTNHP